VFSEFDPGWSGWFALSFAVLVCLELARALWNFRSIPRLKPVAGSKPPDLMTVIPARDEERVIARAVASLPHDSVIVVDDHSADGTAEAARKAGAGVIQAPALPRGAVGKSHACMAGAKTLESRWILFADADTWFEKGFLDAAVAAAEARELAFLSIHLETRPRSWRDALVAPLVQALYYASIRPRADPAGAFDGQCVLVRRDAYEFAGGHGAILNSIADGLKLAGLAARHRLKFGAARSGRLGHAEFRDAARSMRRRGYRLLLLEGASAAMSIVFVSALAWWPLSAVWAGIDGGWSMTAPLIVAPMLFALPWYRSLALLLMPLAVCDLAASTWSGLVSALGGGGIEWKGRRV